MTSGLHRIGNGPSHITYLTVPCFWVLERIRLQHSPERGNTLLALVSGVLWETAMQILLDLLRAGVGTTLVFCSEPFKIPGILEAQIERSRQCFPHLSAESVWKADLNEARALWISQ